MARPSFFSNRKNSSSGPVFISKPMDAASSIARLNTYLGSPWKYSPPGCCTSHIILAIDPLLCPHGNSWKVFRSGFSTISDSSIRTNPSTEEPSKDIPWPIAFSIWDTGMATFLTMPWISTNCSLTNLTSFSLIFLRISSLEVMISPIIRNIMIIIK